MMIGIINGCLDIKAMEIKESEIREQYHEELGIHYHENPTKYMLWRKEKISEWKKEGYVKILRDDPESYPDHPKAKRISITQAIWVEDEE